jgi:hypothetical protein
MAANEATHAVLFLLTISAEIWHLALHGRDFTLQDRVSTIPARVMVFR